MTSARALLALALATVAPPAIAEDPGALATALSRESPRVAAMVAAHPEWKRAWAEDFWADALLRAPLVPGTPWRVHDLRRPQPPRVRPAMAECRGPRPPRGAVRLFDGAPVGLAGPKLDQWTASGGVLTAGAREPNRLSSRQAFGDVLVHLEYREPNPPAGVWQYRGNSGVFLMGLYEVQILDALDAPTYPDGQTGALYGQVPPLANAALPAGRWECLDIQFRAPRFAGAALRRTARVSIWHNGVRVQREAAFLGPTAFAMIKPYAPHAEALPLQIQDHGDGTSRVSFRNVWALPTTNARAFNGSRR